VISVEALSFRVDDMTIPLLIDALIDPSRSLYELVAVVSMFTFESIGCYAVVPTYNDTSLLLSGIGVSSGFLMN